MFEVLYGGIAGPLHNDKEVHTETVFASSENAVGSSVKLKKTPSVAFRSSRDRAMIESFRATAFVVLRMDVARPGIADLVVEGARLVLPNVDDGGAGDGDWATIHGKQAIQAKSSSTVTLHRVLSWLVATLLVTMLRVGGRREETEGDRWYDVPQVTLLHRHGPCQLVSPLRSCAARVALEERRRESHKAV